MVERAKERNMVERAKQKKKGGMEGKKKAAVTVLYQRLFLTVPVPLFVRSVLHSVVLIVQLTAYSCSGRFNVAGRRKEIKKVKN